MSPLQQLGRGVSFPLAPDLRSGRLLYLDADDVVRQSIQLILETEPGERLMRPTFGCGLRRHLMKPNTSATRALIRRDVEKALENFEPRIRLETVGVDPGDDPSMILIRIAYAHRLDGRKDNLVYPFYLE